MYGTAIVKRIGKVPMVNGGIFLMGESYIALCIEMVKYMSESSERES